MDTRTIGLQCTHPCIQLLVQWLYEQSKHALFPYKYDLDQFLEALEMAQMYQLDHFGNCVASRILDVLRQSATELSPADMYYVWLRVTRPSLATPIHQELAEWCVEKMARMVMDSEKVQELVRALREDATSSVGNKRKREAPDTDEVFLNVMNAVDRFLTSRYSNV